MKEIFSAPSHSGQQGQEDIDIREQIFSEDVSIPLEKKAAASEEIHHKSFSIFDMDTLILPVVPDDEAPDYALALSNMRTLKIPAIPASRPSSCGISNGDAQNTAVPLEERPTVPMIVLKSIASQQGEEIPVMHSEISGAASGAAIVGIGNIVGSILKFGSNYLLQVGFGATLYGLYSICLAMVQLVASLCNLGLSDTMIRYTAIYQSKQQACSLQGLISFCTMIAGIMGIVGACSVLLFSTVFAISNHEPALAPLMRLMAPLVPLLCLQAVWLGSLQGLKLFKWRVIAERLLVPSVLLLLVLLFFWLAPSLYTIALATILSIVSGTLASAYFLYRTAMRPKRERRYEIQEWLSFAVFNFLTSITEVVLESIDTLLLVILLVNATQIGQYNAAVKISDFIAMPLFSLNTMFAPTIAELHSRGEAQKLETMYQVVNKWIVMLSLPIFCIASLFSPSLLQLSGRSFQAAWPLLVVSAFGSMINAATGSVGYMLLMTGHQKISFLNSLLSVGLNILLGVLLIPHFGAMGAAIGTTVTLAIVNILRYVQIRTLLKFYPYNWHILRPLGAGLFSTLWVGGLLFLFSDAALLIRLLLMPLFLLCYAGCLYLFKLGPEDAIVLDAFRRKFVHIRRRNL
ncbi:flippase [Dictyobacter formicarum]|uniref:Polysaccharide biosynthesis protein C-terminal domain-containing protein n=1 Tax=Dictyobacter formicarum TaxID=2778368 RepID=A0ABQ3V8M8_9CHLR|nr:flippase [Dictyobacter formicarum]GHO82125.1 hypothetical protein KSZ_01310 [Dictyobacter formicarum]